MVVVLRRHLQLLTCLDAALMVVLPALRLERLENQFRLNRRLIPLRFLPVYERVKFLLRILGELYLSGHCLPLPSGIQESCLALGGPSIASHAA